MSEPLLQVKNLHTSFAVSSGEVRAVNGVSFNLDRGKVLGIVGESGSGKSVTAYSIMRILVEPGRITEGQILFNGDDIVKYSKRQMREFRGSRISIIFQDPMTSLNPVYTVGNQLREAILLHTNRTHKQAQERALEMLELVGVNQPDKRLKQYPHELSGGMRQRVMIAMALACEPDILIADEPTTALDVTIQAQIINTFEELQQKLGIAYLFIAHDLLVVQHISRRIAVMYLGRIVEIADSDELITHPIHPYTQSLISAIPVPDPDTARTRHRIPLEGDVPSPMNMPTGCAFRTRCRYCTEKCKHERPELREVAPGHSIACWNV